MYLIRKIIIKEWLRFFFISFLGLLIILTVGTLLPGFLRGNVTPQEVIFNHLLELPGNMKKILPVTCLVASLFSINKLKSRNELVAIFASSYTRIQFILTITTLSSFVALFLYLSSGYIEPFVKSKKSSLISDSGKKFRNLKSQGLKSSNFGSGKVWYRGSNYFFSFRAFDKKKYIINDVDLYYINSDDKISKKIKAQKLIHQVGNLWKGIKVQIFDNLSDENFASFKKYSELVIPIDETPTDFFQIESDITTLTPQKLKRYINQLKEVGINTNEYQMLYFDKYTSSILCILFALLGSLAIFSPNRRSSSVGKNLFFVFVFVIFYWLIYSYFYELGKSSKLSPEIASSIVPFCFSLILFIIYIKNRKLS